MQRVLLCFIVFLLFPINVLAVTRTVSWDPVTTYTDNTQIVNYDNVIVLPIIYDIKMDNIIICTVVGVTSYTFEHTNADQDHMFSARAKLQTGEESAWSPDFLWHCPPAGASSLIPDKPIIILPIRRH